MDFNNYVRANGLHLYDRKVDINELIRFLQQNKYIKELSLGSCEIGNEGAEALANLTNLTRLDLSGNKIDKEGAKALTKALNDGKFPKLIEFTFNGNSISTDDKKMLDLAFKRNIERSKQVNNKVVVITSATIAILAITAALIAHFAFQASLLTTGIIAGVGACCLVAAAIVSYYDRPSNSLENSNVEEFVTNEEHTIV